MKECECGTDSAGIDFVDMSYLKRNKGVRNVYLTHQIIVDSDRTRFKGKITDPYKGVIKFNYVIDTPSRNVMVGDICYCIPTDKLGVFVRKTQNMHNMQPYGFRVGTGCDGKHVVEFTHKSEERGL